MSYRSTAASVAESKRKHPAAFCPKDRCLWRTNGDFTFCPRHGGPDPRRVREGEFDDDGRGDAERDARKDGAS